GTAQLRVSPHISRCKRCAQATAQTSDQLVATISAVYAVDRYMAKLSPFKYRIAPSVWEHLLQRLADALVSPASTNKEQLKNAMS
ncbi:unnamed protein product, partial [Symbiodinium microadriaticum]